ncbi:unnamed protein product, partial [Prorocentrum cordatum]
SASPMSRSTDVEIEGQNATITQKDCAQFNAAKSTAEPAILEDTRAKTDLGHGRGQQLQLYKKTAAWKLNGAKQHRGGGGAEGSHREQGAIVKIIDGKDLYFDSSIIADLTKELKGGKQVNAGGAIELDNLGLAPMQMFVGDASAGFDLGRADDDEAERKDFDAAADRARDALMKLRGLRNKITHPVGETNAGSEVRKGKIKKTVGKGKQIDELIKGYHDLVKTKSPPLPPGLCKTTAENISEKITVDSKVGHAVVAMIRPDNELGDRGCARVCVDTDSRGAIVSPRIL